MYYQPLVDYTGKGYIREYYLFVNYTEDCNYYDHYIYFDEKLIQTHMNANYKMQNVRCLCNQAKISGGCTIDGKVVCESSLSVSGSVNTGQPVICSVGDGIYRADFSVDMSLLQNWYDNDSYQYIHDY